MESVFQDLRYALRAQLRSPGVTLAAVLTLALGIGANTAIFSAVHSILVRSLPYKDPQQLVMFWEGATVFNVPFVPITGGNFHEWKRQEGVFSGMAGFRIRSRSNGRAMLLSTEQDSIRVNGLMISANFLEVLGVAPLMGRGFTAGEDEPGAGQVALLSYSLWNSHFGADSQVMGRIVRLNGTPREIIGVLPAGFFFPPPVQFIGSVAEHAAEIFVPYWIDPNDQRIRVIRSLARLREGVSIEQAVRDLQPVADRLVEKYPDSSAEGLKPVLLPLHGQAVEQSRSRLLALQGAVGLILLIACVNVANLVLARSAARRRELALRAALGADRRRIVRMLVTENLLLAFAGGVLGLILASAAMAPLASLGASHVPRLGPVAVDTAVLIFSLFLTILTALIFGLVPALQASRKSLADSLRAGRGASGGSGASHFYRRALVISEVALAMIPLIGAGLMLRSLWMAQQAEVGFEAQGVVSVQMQLPEQRYPDNDSVKQFYERLQRGLESLPGVEESGAVSLLPFSGGRTGGVFVIQGRPRPGKDNRANQTGDFRWVLPGYFETLKIPLLEGRLFNHSDRADAPPRALVDETLAQRLWPKGGVLGAQLTWGDETVWRTVVGVVGTIQYQNLRPQPEVQGIVYLPQAQEPQRGLSVVLRTSGPPASLSAPVRRQVAGLDAELPVELRTLQSYLHEAQDGQRSPAILLGILAALALLLAAVGLYGILSFLARQRSQEIGIRVALGADRQEILRLMMSQTAWIVLIGLVAGLAGAAALSRYLALQYLSGILFGISPFDLTTYLGVTLLFLAIAVLASYLPARRALSVDPSTSLRTE